MLQFISHLLITDLSFTLQKRNHIETLLVIVLKTLSWGNTEILNKRQSHTEALMWITEQPDFLQFDGSCISANMSKAEILSSLTKSICRIDGSSKNLPLKVFKFLRKSSYFVNIDLYYLRMFSHLLFSDIELKSMLSNVKEEEKYSPANSARWAHSLCLWKDSYSTMITWPAESKSSATARVCIQGNNSKNEGPL